MRPQLLQLAWTTPLSVAPVGSVVGIGVTSPVAKTGVPSAVMPGTPVCAEAMLADPRAASRAAAAQPVSRPRRVGEVRLLMSVLLVQRPGRRGTGLLATAAEERWGPGLPRLRQDGQGSD